ncbi:hypothetical protein COCCADRAFT_85233, partial [Bipolaris zeicola 26-R-13]
LISYRILTMVIILVPGFRDPFLLNSCLFRNIIQNQPLCLSAPEGRILKSEIREGNIFFKVFLFFASHVLYTSAGMNICGHLDVRFGRMGSG